MKLTRHLAAWMWVGGFVVMAPASRAGDQIRTYSVPKEHPEAAATAAPMPAADIPMADFKSSPIHWTAPAQWKTLAPTTIRIGNFEVTADGKKAEIAITSFPGTVGGELPNVNRWRKEVGLAETTPDQIVSNPVTVDGSEGKLYDFTGDSGRTLVASIFRDGNTWFFKMRGDKVLVGSQQPAFADFLKSVKFSPNAGASDVPASPTAGLSDTVNPHAGLGLSAPPAGPGTPDPHAGLGLSANEGSNDRLPKWTVPANWQEKAAGAMVLKSFSVPGDQGQSATVSISMLGGPAGGVLANVNRWRGQVGLAPLDSPELAKETQSIDTTVGKVVVADIVGNKAGQPTRLVAAIVPHGDSTWFYKLLGQDALVAREKNNFIHFVQTVQYP